MMHPTCTTPEEGAESGKQPGERLKKPAVETGSERPNVKPKKQRRESEKWDERPQTERQARQCSENTCT